MNLISKPIFAGAAAILDVTGPLAGKIAFIGVFVLLLIWLLLMPGRLIGQADGPPSWWRNTRVWAIVVTVVQILVYLRWG
jgi:hypothetical protein